MSEVADNINKLIGELGPKYLYKAMANACALVRNEAVNTCPKDTGNLRRSIDFEVSNDGLEGVIFSNAEYAPYVEVGTGIYATKGGGRQTPWRVEGHKGWFTTKGMKAQPFLEPAVMSKRSDIENCFEGLL